MFKIFLDDPVLGQLEKDYLAQAIDMGFVSTAGPFVPELENNFATRLGGESHCVAVQSGTAALQMALLELGIGPGDEVIVPDLTFVASVNPVLYVGAEPVLADIRPDTFTIDLQSIKRLITPQTKAIIVVHLYGSLANLQELKALAVENNIYLIEDATESLFGKYRNQFSGTFGDAGCFSFNGNKLLTTGGGGMIVVKNHKSREHIRYLVNQAKDDKFFNHSEVGYNYRMTNIEAALGLAQFSRAEEIVERKKIIRSIYEDYLSSISGVRLQTTEDREGTVFWMNVLCFKTQELKEKVMQSFESEGIPFRYSFKPLHALRPYQKFRVDNTQVAEEISSLSLCLPSSALNGEEQIVKVCEKLREVINGY